jgi:hypothetical protein
MYFCTVSLFLLISNSGLKLLVYFADSEEDGFRVIVCQVY